MFLNDECGQFLIRFHGIFTECFNDGMVRSWMDDVTSIKVSRKGNSRPHTNVGKICTEKVQ